MARLPNNLIVGSKGFLGSSLIQAFPSISAQGISSKTELNDFLSTKHRLEFENVFWAAGSASPSDKPMPFTSDHPDFIWLKRFLDNNRIKFRRLIYFSSGGCTYANSPKCLSENSERKAQNFYGAVKLACEKLLVDYSKQDSTNFVRITLRVANVFGVNQGAKASHGVMAHWINQYRTGVPLQVFGAKEIYRDFINVQDVVVASKLASEIHFSTDLNIGSGSRLFISELLSVFKLFAGENYPVELEPRREFDVQGYCLDITKARNLLSWSPNFSSVSDIENVFREGMFAAS